VDLLQVGMVFNGGEGFFAVHIQVQNPDVITFVQQFWNKNRANVSRAAGDQYSIYRFQANSLAVPLPR
jgi:hypothetical protein